jgi:hypothetical protein
MGIFNKQKFDYFEFRFILKNAVEVYVTCRHYNIEHDNDTKRLIKYQLYGIIHNNVVIIPVEEISAITITPIKM